jgi:putative transposase
MSKNYYSEINLHVVWHTKANAPLLTSEVEPIAHRYLRSRIHETTDVLLHEIGGIETHVHIAITAPPTLLISEWVGQLKGATSHYVNQQIGLRSKVLQWQAGYGVVTFGTRDLEWVCQYIRNQREHHKRGTAHERLERIDMGPE